MITRFRNWLAARHRRRLRAIDRKILFPEIMRHAKNRRTMLAGLGWHISNSHAWTDAPESEFPETMKGLAEYEKEELAMDISQMVRLIGSGR